MPKLEPKIPKPRVIGSTYCFVERETEDHVRRLAGLEPLPPDPSAPTKLIRLATFAARLGVHPRTVKRKVRQTYGALVDSATLAGALAKPSAEPAASPVNSAA